LIHIRDATNAITRPVRTDKGVNITGVVAFNSFAMRFETNT
jgi:hypothetical protein